MLPMLRDDALVASKALPNGATTVKSNGLDVGPTTSKGEFAPCIEGEYLLEAPALTTTELPDTKTVVYDIIESDNSDLSSSVVVAASVITQTGASSAGASAATFRYRPKLGCKRYHGFQATGVSGTLAATKTGYMTYVS